MTLQQLDAEEAVRRRFAIALGSIPLDMRVLSVTVHVGGYTLAVMENDAYPDGHPDGWLAAHDHDPDRYDGHVSMETGPTPQAAIAACHAAAVAWDEATAEANPE